jgi:hypothetical protein
MYHAGTQLSDGYLRLRLDCAAEGNADVTLGELVAAEAQE